MALITRVSRLFKADLHAVLDRVEEPEVLLRQAVREMEEELARDEQRIKLWRHEQRQLDGRRSEAERSLSDIEEELEVCFEAGSDDLARALIRRRLEAGQLLKALARRRESIEQSCAGLDARVQENRARLEHVRQKAALLAEQDAAGRREDDWSADIGTDLRVREEDVEVAFLKEKRRRSRS